jgi:RNA polymerase sigma factor (sigma-70 family)
MAALRQIKGRGRWHLPRMDMENLTGPVIQHLRKTALLQDGAGMTDGQLLGCFLEHRDEAAFAALVKRHGPMVFGVCRRLLPHHDAEDAFQATFLVLLKKAASILPREMVANWLYGVAQQTALHSRRTTARRRTRERQVTPMPEPAVAEQDLWHDLQPLLDQELARLPDKYRVALVLCDLEGKTRKEAARQFGCPEGTLAGRLARARVMLAKRLARHGLALSGGALAAVLAQNVAAAGVPAPVVASTIKAAALLAAGQGAAGGAISVKVAALAEGVLQSMLLTKLKVASALLLVVVALSGMAGLIYQAQAAEQPKARRVEEKKDFREKQPARKDGRPRPDKEQGRILRWKIVFNTKDGKEYAEQLEALGAKLAIPTRERNQYRVICDLSKRPVRTTVEDISRVDHIFLLETAKEPIRMLAKELGLKEPPEHIVVFLPRLVEDELRRKEVDFAHRPEKEIVETTFVFSRSKRGFDIQVASQR